MAPPSLAAGGSACDYRQISHEKYDYPDRRYRPGKLRPNGTNAAPFNRCLPEAFQLALRLNACVPSCLRGGGCVAQIA